MQIRDLGTTRSGSARVGLLVALAVVALVAVLGIGLLWWSLRTVSDPIDEQPVSATATVLSSSPCQDGQETTVRISGVDESVRSELDGCGFAVGSRIAVEYLAGHPELARLYGAAKSGAPPWIRVVLPPIMLLSGLAAVVMLIVAATRYQGRRRSRSSPTALSVAELQRRLQQRGAESDPDRHSHPHTGSASDRPDRLTE